MAIDKRSLTDVRKDNCRLIFDLLQQNDGMTLLDIEQTSGLSRPTVIGMVRAMQEANLVISLGKRAANGGRLPLLYGINPDAYYAIGIDFEYPVSRVAIADMKGELRYTSRRDFADSVSATEVIERLLAQIRELVTESRLGEEQLLGIGLGMPGYIDLKNNVSSRFERIPDWMDIRIGEILSREIGVPVYMENDVHLMFRAERDLWGKKNKQDALFIAIRSGIGMAIFQRGHIIEGEHGNAGHIGHTTIQADGPLCKCGKCGCLELYVGEQAILQQYRDLTGKEVQNVSEIVVCAGEGEREAAEVLSRAGRYLGIGIGNVVNLFDVNTVILSSEFDHQLILEKAQEELDRSVNIPQKKKAVIHSCKLSEEQFALGGCKLVFHRNRHAFLENVQLKNL